MLDRLSFVLEGQRCCFNFIFLGCVLIDFRKEDGGNASIFDCLFLMDFRFCLKDNGIAALPRFIDFRLLLEGWRCCFFFASISAFLSFSFYDFRK